MKKIILGVFDRNFSDDIKKILAASSNGFVKNRFENKKNPDGEYEFRTDLPLLGMQKAIISTATGINEDDRQPLLLIWRQWPLIDCHCNFTIFRIINIDVK